jgi:protocatechuate 3,4-dioxygenase beta subunit
MAQASSSPGKAAKDNLATIEGQVRNSLTGEPIAKADLILTPASAGADSWTQSYATHSDASGKFEIHNITPGKYRLRASRRGFVARELGAGAVGKSGAILDLAAGNQQLQRAKDILLVPQSVIAGRVLDSEGEPMERAQIQLLRFRYVNGKKVLSTSATAYTNDLGEYRFSGIAPGKYSLYAANMEAPPPSSAITEQYLPIYYPDARDTTAAATLDLTPGSQLQAADMVLRKARTVTVKGRVASEIPGAVGAPVVRLGLQNGHDDSAAHSRRSLPAKINRTTGEFEIQSVTPGSYVAIAEVAQGGRGYFGIANLTVTGSDNINDLIIKIPNPISITGRIRVDSTGTGQANKAVPPAWNSGSVSLFHGGLGTVNKPEHQPLSADGSFQFHDLPPRKYGILASNLPDGFYMKSVVADGVDVTDTGVDCEAGSPAPIELWISPSAGRVNGIVQGSSDSVDQPGITVVLVPKDKSRRAIARLYQQTATDAQGRFSFRNLAPGDYKVYAWEEVEPTSWLDPDFMEPIEDLGVVATVPAGGATSVDVKAIPANSR